MAELSIGGQAPPLTTEKSAQRWVIASTCVVLLVLLVGFAGLIRQGEVEARQALADRLEVRAALTGSFTRDFVDDLAARQRRQAARLLADPEVDPLVLESVVRSLEFEEAVVLDQDGRVLQAWPARPELIGQVMAPDHAHLRSAVAGRTGISGTVASPARGTPMAAVAVPFDSPDGRRVLSGAFALTATPLGTYLDRVVPLAGGTAYLVDESGQVLAGGDDAGGRFQAWAGLPAGVSELPASGVTVAVAEVPGTPWRVVLAAPTEVLYRPVAGGRRASWGLWFALAASGCLVVLLFVRLARASVRGAATARADYLTGLPNRRAMQEALDRAASLSARHQVPLAALMVDIDRFKAINDAHGHKAGDLVLRATAAALAGATRKGDVAGRWGGEEFLVLLPHADRAAAASAAERIRDAVATTVRAGDRTGDPVTVSIGVATLADGDTATLLRQADAALYVAKANGRNRVEVADGCDNDEAAGARSP